jgi:hypothetical protein
MFNGVKPSNRGTIYLFAAFSLEYQLEIHAITVLGKNLKKASNVNILRNLCF